MDLPNSSEGKLEGSEGQPGGEFLPILQDFVPSRGRCPATLWDFTKSKKQGKGTADLMIKGALINTLYHPFHLQIVDLGTQESLVQHWGRPQFKSDNI